MKEYRQLPLTGFDQLATIKEVLLPLEKGKGVGRPYTLSPINFIDAIENRIKFIDFYNTTVHRARFFVLRDCLDQQGRVMVDLAIDPSHPPEQQAQSLVHEIVHIYRNSWDKLRKLTAFTSKFERTKEREEAFVEREANRFYQAHPSLAALALCHLWMRYDAQQPQELQATVC